MLSESARATSAAEARFRINDPNSRGRTVKVIALDALSERVAKQLASRPWNSASFFTASAFAGAPHVRYSVAALLRDGETAGYAVYRHLHEPRWRVTLLVDFLADPDDEEGFETLLRWVDREARQEDSDKIRTFAMHAGFRSAMRRSGYFQVKSTMEFVVKVNGAEVSPEFYESTDAWHVTLGDSDQDR